MLYFAHLADWLSWAFFVPVVVFLVWLAVTQVKLRRETRDQGGGTSREP